MGPKKERNSHPPLDGTSRTLVVRGVPSTATSSDLTTLFSSLASVQHAFVVAKKLDTGIQGEGFGFVTFSEKSDAVKVASKSTIPWTDGKTNIAVAYAKPRQRRPVEEEEKSKHVQVSKDPNIPSVRPRLIFRNLSWKVRSPQQLENVLVSYGKPKEVRIPRGKGGRMTGFAFVEMKTRKAARRVIEEVNGMEIEGRMVAVDWCVSKDDWTEHHSETVKTSSAVPDDDEHTEVEEIQTEDEDDSNFDEDDEPEVSSDNPSTEPTAQTLFVRNIPYLVTRASLHALFRPLGHIASLYLVTDPQTGLSRGTAFLTFSSPSDAETLLALYERIKSNTATQEETQRYTLEGRVLDFLPAVNRDEATRLKDEHATKKHDDKRNLYLLKEGDIDPRHPFYPSLSTMDISLRRDSVKQRKDMLASNPSLHLSLTRLAVRNIPRAMDETELRKLAVKAVIEFDEEAKTELREQLTEEEVGRDQFEVKGKLVRQSKIVLDATGRSRGYGFIEYNSHASALKGLRWMNARVVGERQVESEGDRKRRLLVEFAIENAQVVKRRKEREDAARRKAMSLKDGVDKAKGSKVEVSNRKQTSNKRKRGDKDGMDEKRNVDVEDAKVGTSDIGKIIGAKRFRRKLEQGRK
jgi:nucleolar protein 4